MAFSIGDNPIMSGDGIIYLWGFGHPTSGANIVRDMVADAGASYIRDGEPNTSPSQGEGFLRFLFPNNLLETQGYIDVFGQQVPPGWLSKYYNGRLNSGTYPFYPYGTREIMLWFSGTEGNSNYNAKMYSKHIRLSSWYEHDNVDSTGNVIDLTDDAFINSVRKEWFGYGLAAGSALVCVGSPKYNTGSGDIGRVYVFTSRKYSSWPSNEFVTYIERPAGTHLNFGSFISISENRIAISAESTPATSRGAVYTYNTTTSPYTLISTLTGDVNSNRFGASTAISNKKLFVGIPAQSANTGQVNVYNIDTGTLLSSITPSGVGYTGPASTFGECVAVGEGMCAIGAPDYQENGVIRGAVFLVRTSDYSLIKKITRPPYRTLRNAGTSYYFISDGSTTVTGRVINSPTATRIAPRVGELIEISFASGTEESKLNGSWKVLTRANDTTFTFETTSALSAGTYNDSTKIGVLQVVTDYGDFGSAIAIGSGRIIVGDPRNGSWNTSGHGAVFIYDLAGNLISVSYPSVFGGLTGSNPQESFYGSSVCVSNGRIIVGAPGHLASGDGSYVDYTLGGPRYITGCLFNLNLEGVIQSYGFQDLNFYESSPFGKEANYTGYVTVFDAVSGARNDTNIPWGLGNKVVFYNDDLYTSCFGFLNQRGAVTRYGRIIRSYTPYDAIEMQRGLR